jgi:hypothetical protein
MEKPETMALLTMGVFTVVLAWKMVRRFQMPSQELALTRALSIAGLVGLVWTGVLGGKLMFEHAAGIPTHTLQTEIPDRAAGHGRAEDEEHGHGGADTAKAAPSTLTPPHTH